MWQCEHVLLTLSFSTILTELHREDPSLHHAHLPNLIRVLHDLRHHRLDLIDLGHLVRVKYHEVSLLDRPNNLCKSQFSRHELLKAFLGLINLSN